MKLKRFLILAVVFSLALAAAFIAPVANNKASAALATVNKLSGYEYSIEYLLKDFGLEKLGANSTYFAGRSVKYRLTKDGATDVAENADGYSDAAFVELDASSTVKFLRSGATYTFVVTEDEAEKEYDVTTVDKAAIADNANVYTNDEDALNAYRDAVKEYAATLKTTDSFKFADLEEKASITTILSNEYFDVTNMKVVAHYYVPGATTDSTTNGTTLAAVSFNTNKVGDYSVYLTFTDGLGNSESVNDLILGKGGYYTDTDEDGEIDYAVDTLVIPVFTFTVEESSKPEVSLTVSENAYINLKYKIDAFNITATDYSTLYEFYFIPEGDGAYIDKSAAEYDVSNSGDAKYIAAVLNNPNVQDVTDMLDTSSMSFTPTEKGYYYVLLKIYNNRGYSDEIMSYAIPCLEEYKEVVPEKQFFKYNVTSIVFLSISALCLIGIIVVLLIKPKNKELEVKSKSDDGAQKTDKKNK